MELNIVVGSNLNWLGITVFCVAGYFIGFLTRNIGIIKIVLLFMVAPFFLDLLTALNNIWQATIPFILCALVGHLGERQTVFHIRRASDFVRDLAGR